MKLCECGCGQEVKPENRFIYHHNIVGKNNPMKDYEVAIRNTNARRGKIHPSQRGEKHWNYKGGGRDGDGYWEIVIKPDDPFFCMADRWRHIFRDRYNLAKKLGRPLEPWEQCHHMGVHFPIGSYEDKGDDSDENICLATDSEHSQITRLVTEVKKLKQWQLRVSVILAETGLLDRVEI